MYRPLHTALCHEGGSLPVWSLLLPDSLVWRCTCTGCSRRELGSSCLSHPCVPLVSQYANLIFKRLLSFSPHCLVSGPGHRWCGHLQINACPSRLQRGLPFSVVPLGMLLEEVAVQPGPADALSSLGYILSVVSHF